VVVLTAVWLRQTGGHLGSSLGVVELTTALLHVFGSPDDKIVYDVGHQAYVHKMLTGRRRLMPTIRQTGGISGVHGCCGYGRAPATVAWLRARMWEGTLNVPQCLRCDFSHLRHEHVSRFYEEVGE